jgi:hypothetical protein
MPRASTEGWQGRFGALLAQGERESALELLEGRATAHAGTPRAEDKRAAARLIEKTIDRDERWGWAEALVRDESATRRELACLLLAALYADHRDEVRALLPALADDGHWEVRLWAGGLFEELLAAHFDELYGAYRSWLGHPSQFVRVAVATSVMAKGHRDHPERAAALLELVEPLLVDRAHEVERNLGPFAIGAGLLRLFPQETLDAVQRWSRSEDEQTRWNVAMTFSAAAARKHVEAGMPILAEYARDGRPKVWRAVAMALRNLLKGDPRLAEEVARWREDERRLPAALALRGR